MTKSIKHLMNASVLNVINKEQNATLVVSCSLISSMLQKQEGLWILSTLLLKLHQLILSLSLILSFKSPTKYQLCRGKARPALFHQKPEPLCSACVVV